MNRLVVGTRPAETLTESEPQPNPPLIHFGNKGPFLSCRRPRLLVAAARHPPDSREHKSLDIENLLRSAGCPALFLGSVLEGETTLVGVGAKDKKKTSISESVR